MLGSGAAACQDRSHRISWTCSGVSVARADRGVPGRIARLRLCRRQEHHDRLRVGSRCCPNGRTRGSAGSNVDIIVAPASTQVEPARQATRTIPIVFAQHADPIGIGHVASFARPGGNITGVSMVLTEMSVKGLEILVETVPNAKRIGVLWNPTTPTYPHILTALQSAALTAGVELVLAPAQAVEDFEGAYAAMSRDRVSGVLVPSSPLTNSQRTALAELGVKHALPAMFANKANVQAGGLMSYGSDFNYMYRRVAFYIDKILKGERPAELPVEQASKYQLVINLKTARALGIAVPSALLARADEVIE